MVRASAFTTVQKLGTVCTYLRAVVQAASVVNAVNVMVFLGSPVVYVCVVMLGTVTDVGGSQGS